jgi:hypothetical protein
MRGRRQLQGPHCETCRRAGGIKVLEFPGDVHGEQTAGDGDRWGDVFEAQYVVGEWNQRSAGGGEVSCLFGSYLLGLY